MASVWSLDLGVHNWVPGTYLGGTLNQGNPGRRTVKGPIRFSSAVQWCWLSRPPAHLVNFRLWDCCSGAGPGQLGGPLASVPEP